MNTIRIKESKKKAKPPAYIVVFLGILFNTLTMTLKITEEHLEKLKNLLQHWLVKTHATKKET